MNRAQVWVETVIYTMVGLALIGFVLAMVIPRLNEYRDKSVIEETITSLDRIDNKIGQVLSAPGNIRIIDFVLKKGYLTIDAEKDLIVFNLEESSSIFSEPGVSIQIGRINVTTLQTGKKYSVSLMLPVDGDLIINGLENSKKLSPVAIPYKLSFENTGNYTGSRQIILFKEASGA